MDLVDRLAEIWRGGREPFLVYKGATLSFGDVEREDAEDLADVRAGDVVALVGDFDPRSILILLKLIDRGAIIVPLTVETAEEHEYFLESAHVDVVIDRTGARRRKLGTKHPLLQHLRDRGNPGLVLFSTGTTGRPKAILHDFSHFLKRFETPRPALRTLNFLLFDHIGGLNTLFHTLFNKGVVVAPTERTVDSVLQACAAYNVEVLPTTPTFLRMMLMSGAMPDAIPGCLNIITYGTERMDQPTLDQLCEALPWVDFRQTYGMSELGIMRIKSEARNSLYMKIGGEGVETRVVDGVLHIRSRTRMLGYLNAPSPFDDEGWYDTKDVVEQRSGYYRITGRLGDVINVGGLKFMASDVERAALEFPGVSLVKAYSRANPISGQHVELLVEPAPGCTVQKHDLAAYLKEKLRPHMTPKRIVVGKLAVGHRFKKA